MRNLWRGAGACNPRGVICYFDKVQFRASRRPNKKQVAFLRKNAASVDVRLGHPIRGSKSVFVWTIVGPNKVALEFLARLGGLFVNYVEIARDVIASSVRSAQDFQFQFDSHFVQRWHGRRETRRVGNGTYTGQNQPGHRFVWYADRACKRTGDPHCFHLEGRHHGSASVRRLGVDAPDDLLTFDHESYWKRHLCLYDIDLRRLGRAHRNRVTGQRRQQPVIKQFGRVSYDIDLRTGGTLFRIFAAHDYQPIRSVQKFVDSYGRRGPFLRRLGVPSSIVICDNASSDRKSLISLPLIEDFDAEVKTMKFEVQRRGADDV